ncbi:ferritin-like domain-containing protein [Kitasatospora indigofera]|uniref:ferritin-like domain-containing protein n=1 Tax=Kitasatospora indigofera TaxID=67307 RepID=UPI003250131C
MQRRRRRTTLALGLLAAATVLTACTGSGHKDGGEQRQADPDLPVRTRAVAATDALLAAYDTVIAGPGAGRAGELQPLRAELLRHRAAFAEGLPSAAPTAGSSTGAAGGTDSPGGSGTATTGTPGATAPAEPSAAVTTVAELGAAERRTAQARLADLPTASPDLARLLAAVSASDALHAVALGDTTPVTTPAPAPTASAQASASASASASGPAGASASASATSPSTASATSTGSGSPAAGAAPLPDVTATALQSALAAEHAAVYGYGVVGAKLPDDQQRADARTAFATHEARRDTWRRLLAGAGATPGAAAAGYQLPFAVADAAGAARLAAHIEARLTDVYGELVAALPADRRVTAADALRGTALQARRWGSAVTAFPGLPEPAAASAGGSAAPTPTG